MFACASEEEKTSNDFGVRDITPYFTGGNEDSCEMRFEFQANLTDKTYALDFSQNWEIEKISLENYNFYSGTLNNKTVEKNDNKIINNDFIYENKNDDLSRISAIFYKILPLTQHFASAVFSAKGYPLPGDIFFRRFIGKFSLTF